MFVSDSNVCETDDKKFNELFILRPNKLFRFGVERIIFRDIQSETIPMEYILHKEIL